MPDWFRSVAVLVVAFVAVAVVTVGLAFVIVPNPAVSAPAGEAPPEGGSGGAVPSPGATEVTAIGGTLAVTGDRELGFHLDREQLTDRYALAGEEGRIIFEGVEPPDVAQISFDGLEFFLDPGDCDVTPGERHDPTGVAALHLRCEQIADVRDQGVVTVEGTVGIAADLLGLRGGLPESGGTLQIGSEPVEFEFAAMTVPSGGNFSGIFAGTLYDDDTGTVMTFAYDPETHEFTPSEITYDFEVSAIPANACAVATEEIGVLNPHTRVADMTVNCPAVEVPALGTVPIDGTLVVELSEPPS